MEVAEINLDDATDRWQWACRRGHRSWEPTNNHFWCAQCARTYGVDGVFHQLVNRRTRETFDREDLRLVTDAGPYRGNRTGGRA